MIIIVVVVIIVVIIFVINCLQKNIRFHITGAASWEDDLVPMFFVSLRSVKARVHPGTPSTLVVTSVPVLSQHMLFQKAVSQKYVGVACKVARVTRLKIHSHPRRESPGASSIAGGLFQFVGHI